MNFEELKRRVDRTETLVDGRICQTGECHTRLRREWREAWTPLRIVVAGLVTGFVAGRAEPQQALLRLGKLGGPRSLQLISSLTGLLTSVQATVAAMTAKDAAETADEAADDVRDAAAQQASAQEAGAPDPAPFSPPDDTPHAAAGSVDPDATAEPEAVPPVDRRRPDQSWDTQPPPAEAATEISER